MDMVKAFVNAANTYRDGTSCTYCGTVPMLYLTAVATSELRDAPHDWGTIHWCTR